MKIIKTDRGVEMCEFKDRNDQNCMLLQSSIVGDYPDALDRPGTSALWLGRRWPGMAMHLSREHVAELLPHLQAWLETGSFQIEVPR